MQQIALSTPSVLIELIEGQLTTTSLDVATHFAKRHDTVLRAIRQLECSPDFLARNFAEMIVDVDTGKGATRKSPAFRMTRDGFTFLCMGFTGKEAATWKEAYINAFNRMEESLKRDTSPVTPELPPLSMQRWLTTFDSTGQQHTRLLPIDSYIMNTAEFIDHVSHLSERDIPTPQLLQLTMKLMNQLGKRNINFAGFAL